MKRKITKKELKGRFGLIVLGFFSFYLVEPIRDWVSSNININPIIIGAAGILIALYMWDFS